MSPLPASTSNDRSNEDDDDGQWIHVARKSNRRRPRRQPPLAAVDSRPAGASRCVSSIAAEYRSLRASFETTSCCARLRALVSERIVQSAPDITQAVCLGIGTFDPPDGGWEARKRTHTQLAAFLVLVEELGKLRPRHGGCTHPDGFVEAISGDEIRCIFQEPIFTPSDVAFIASLGHRVVADPLACELVDPQTLLYGIHLYRPIYARSLRKFMPAIFVGTGWDVWDGVSLHDDDANADLSRLRTMEREYQKASFPRDTGGTAFSSTSVYWRQSSESKGADRAHRKGGGGAS
ncbi:hypothetical protein DCS_05840 [Drechmeria coniospora]|uniref:SRR1-like domain-containing protein n=1 Tax=Drechmeria coniospora TaxID=98403 RepID=A0A151GP95_DRECN|nr:hypothetical protein DCS_05840 [Drechmeria coniospora]KYK58822.1 hypothetical protein DCS_05840 [Drechmeria coniospora]ODA84188.1 hypothetical protein RJ55_02706 [Drechmeria coniospora]